MKLFLFPRETEDRKRKETQMQYTTWLIIEQQLHVTIKETEITLFKQVCGREKRHRVKFFLTMAKNTVKYF